MPKWPYSYTVCFQDPDYYEDGSKRVVEGKDCGHRHDTFEKACKCKKRLYKKYCLQGEDETVVWLSMRIRENLTARIHYTGPHDDYRVGYKIGKIRTELFYKDEKIPTAPPDIAQLFEPEAILTALEYFVILLKVRRFGFDPPYQLPLGLALEAASTVDEYNAELGISNINPYGNKSKECTCGYCGKSGFNKIIDPKTLFAHYQTCDACGGEIMIDSYYYDYHFGPNGGEVDTQIRSRSGCIKIPDELLVKMIAGLNGAAMMEKE